MSSARSLPGPQESPEKNDHSRYPSCPIARIKVVRWWPRSSRSSRKKRRSVERFVCAHRVVQSVACRPWTRPALTNIIIKILGVKIGMIQAARYVSVGVAPSQKKKRAAPSLCILHEESRFLVSPPPEVLPNRIASTNRRRKQPHSVARPLTSTFSRTRREHPPTVARRSTRKILPSIDVPRSAPRPTRIPVVLARRSFG